MTTENVITVSPKEQERVSLLIKKLTQENSRLKERIADLEKRLDPDAHKPVWYHWLLEQCRNEKCGLFGSNVSQGPQGEVLGEDCKLFEKIKEYRENQHNGETNYVCDGCGCKLHLVYRHGLADNNVITDDEGEPLRKEMLLAGQTMGKYYTEAEWDNAVNQKEQV